MPESPRPSDAVPIANQPGGARSAALAPAETAAEKPGRPSRILAVPCSARPGGTGGPSRSHAVSAAGIPAPLTAAAASSDRGPR